MGKHTDKEWLIEKYHQEGLTISEMSGLCDISPRAIRYHMDKHGIERRKTGPRATKIDKEYLNEKYIREGLSTRDIGKELGCSREVVRRNLQKHGIELRKKSCAWEDRGMHYKTHPRGHEVVGSNGDTCYVHQLIAIAEGHDPYELFCGTSVVHHENNIPWDNRPENISVYENQSDHAKHHYEKEIQHDKNGRFIRKWK